jgi:ABC-type multidrug transport system ATPase subunit
VVNPVINVRGLTKCYGTPAVDNVEFTVIEGEIFGILGVNGAGKMATVECLQGLRRPDGGHMRVLGLDLRTAALQLRSRLGSQLRAAALPDRRRVEEAVRLFGDGDRRSADGPLGTWNLGRPRRSSFASLSRGQRQRLFLALALLIRPEVASFDRLTQGLDPLARGDVWGAPWSLDIATRFRRRTPPVDSMSPITVDDKPRQRRPMGSSESLGAELSHLHPMPTGPHWAAPLPVPYRDVCR